MEDHSPHTGIRVSSSPASETELATTGNPSSTRMDGNEGGQRIGMDEEGQSGSGHVPSRSTGVIQYLTHRKGCIRTCVSLVTALVNVSVIILLVLIVNPYRTELAVVKQQLNDVQATLVQFNQLSSLVNVSKLEGVTGMLEAQVSQLQTSTIRTQDSLLASAADVDTLDTTIQNLSTTVDYLKRLIDIQNLGFNDTVGYCFLGWSHDCSSWLTCPTCTTQLEVPINQSLMVYNPTVTVDFICSMASTLESTPYCIGNMSVPFSVVANREASMFEQLITVQLQMGWTIASASQTNVGLFNVSQVTVSMTHYCRMACTQFCVTISY